MLRTGTLLGLIVWGIITIAVGVGRLWHPEGFTLTIGVGCFLLAAVYGYLTAPPRRF